LERVSARGHAVLRTPRMQVKADEIDFDQKHEIAIARGNVVMVSDLSATLADEAIVNLNTPEATVKGGLFEEKAKVTQDQLLAADTPEQIRNLGQASLIL